MHLYLVSLALYLLAMLSKESAVTLLGLVALYDYCYPGGRLKRVGPRLRRLATRVPTVYAGYLLVVAVYLALRLVALAGEGSVVRTGRLDNPLVELDAGLRVLNALQVAFRYLWLLVFPLHLSYDYSYDQIPLIRSMRDPLALAALLGTAAALFLILRSHRSSRGVFFAICTAIVTFSIVSNAVVPIGTILGERLLYLPSIGFCLAVVLLLRRLSSQPFLPPGTGRAIFIGSVAILVALHGWRTVVRNLDWSSE